MLTKKIVGNNFSFPFLLFPIEFSSVALNSLTLIRSVSYEVNKKNGKRVTAKCEEEESHF
jgi:hypothetical protein